MTTDSLFGIDGRRVLVTGGGAGLGKAIGLGLARRGARIATLDIDGVAAQSTRDEIEVLGAAALAIEGDVSAPGTADRAVGTVVDTWGGLDVLVNNAGVGSLGPAEDTSLEAFTRVYEIDVFSIFEFSKAAHGAMAAAGSGGSIINMASIAAVQALHPDRDAAYHSAKAAVVMLTRALAVEWAPVGIRVNAIAPGWMLTEPVIALQDDPETWAYHMARVPLGRPGVPEDLEGAAVFLASDASSYVTGTLLVVDGGHTAT